ncbi:transmembrane protein 107-like [Oppia nitens]|uniref:transmembrane protein 107-like n=1 Tax=Oppia nitens TaxID=1686743 RepID=UPI0023DCDFB5|nr:transmembrane protein 107-like [Oppia nitens]
MTMVASQLIPMRFIVMMGHLVLIILLLWDRDHSVRSCIHWEFEKSEYYAKDVELIIGLSLSLIFIVIEFLGFLSGFSMFNSMHCLCSLLAHALACMCLCYFITDVWDCSLFWWIFSLFSVMPALSELYIIISAVLFKRF